MVSKISKEISNAGTHGMEEINMDKGKKEISATTIGFGVCFLAHKLKNIYGDNVRVIVLSIGVLVSLACCVYALYKKNIKVFLYMLAILIFALGVDVGIYINSPILVLLSMIWLIFLGVIAKRYIIKK